MAKWKTEKPARRRRSPETDELELIGRVVRAKRVSDNVVQARAILDDPEGIWVCGRIGSKTEPGGVPYTKCKEAALVLVFRCAVTGI